MAALKTQLGALLVFCVAALATLELAGPRSLFKPRDKRPRVAVCLRGTLRYYRQAHASLVRNVIDVNPQYAFDVFIMSSVYVDGNSKQQGPHPVDQEEVSELYKPVRAVYEAPLQYDMKEGVYDTGPRNHVQLRRISEAYGLAAEHEDKVGIKYHWVVGMRSDMFFGKPLLLWKLPVCQHCILGHFEWGCQRGGDVLSTMPFPERLKGRDVCKNDDTFPVLAEAQVKVRNITTPHGHIRNNFDWMYISDSLGSRTMASMSKAGPVYGTKIHEPHKTVSAESYTVTYIVGAKLAITPFHQELFGYPLSLYHRGWFPHAFSNLSTSNAGHTCVRKALDAAMKDSTYFSFDDIKCSA